MKKLALLVFALVGLTAFAGTCIIRNQGQTEINGKLVYGAEMHNDTGVNFLGHKFVVGFIDEDGEIINTKTPTQCLRTYQAGASNYYSANSGVDPDDVGLVLSRMVLDSSLKLGTALTNNMKLSNIVAVRDGDELRVSGTVTNDGNDDYEDVVVCVVVFNDNDEVVIVVLEDKFNLDEDKVKDFSVTVDVTNDDDDTDRVVVFADAENSEKGDQLTKAVSRDKSVSDCTQATATPTLTDAQKTATSAAATETPTATNTPTSAEATQTAAVGTATPTSTPNFAIC